MTWQEIMKSYHKRLDHKSEIQLKVMAQDLFNNKKKMKKNHKIY